MSVDKKDGTYNKDGRKKGESVEGDENTYYRLNMMEDPTPPK